MVRPIEDEASETFIQRLYGDWNETHQTAFEQRLEKDLGFAGAYRRVEESWRALDSHAEAPEVMAYRGEAISTLRRANGRRWLEGASDTGRWFATQWRVAAAMGGLVLALLAWQISPYGFRPGEYRTGIGEQRVVELADHSRVALDAATRLRVRFSGDTRSIELLEGQAQFSVARDPARPFKVIAGDRTIVALGTVFTVEYVDRKVHVAMLEGKVAVLGEDVETSSSRDSGVPKVQSDERSLSAIELTAGEEVHIGHDGHTVVTPKADLEAATAWREGKVIFRTELLGEAISRMNRYSELQLKVDDPALAAKHISGVFEAGDTRGFVSALQKYLPISADYSDPHTVHLALATPDS
jgi:transmembrane sensor